MMNNMQRKTPRKPSMPSPIIASPRASYPNQLIIRTLRTEYEKQTLSMKRKEYDMEDLATSLNTSQALSNQRIVSPRSGRLPLLPEVNTTINNEDSLLTYNNYNKKRVEDEKSWNRSINSGRSPLFTHSRTIAAKSLGMIRYPTEIQVSSSGNNKNQRKKTTNNFSYLRDESFLCLLAENPKLIDLSDLHWISPYAIGQIGNFQTNLQILRLRNLSQINDVTFKIAMKQQMLKMQEAQ